MRVTRRVAINTVAFLFLSAFLVVVLAVQVLPTVFGSTYSIYGIFTAAGGVATNQEVTYRGVQVGRVGRMTLTRDAVRIELIIDAGHRIPSDGTRARVLFKSAVGEQFVDLLPERSVGPVFGDGDEIPVEMTSIPIQTEDLLRELDAVLRSVDPAALGRLVRELGEGLTGHGEDLRDAVRALDVLAGIGAARRGELAGLLRDAADVQDAFVGTREDFVRAVASLRTVAETLAARRGELARTLEAAAGLNTDILALLEARKGDLDRIVADLGTTIRLTHANLGDVDRLLTYLGPFLSDATKAFDAPYFVFNLLANPEDPPCSYDPSSRPVRAVTDTAFKEPTGDFACASNAARASAGAVAELPVPLRIRLERLSWLQLFAQGT